LCVQLANSHCGRQGRRYDNCDEIKRLNCHVTRCNFPSDLWGEAGSLVIREAVNVVMVQQKEVLIRTCVNCCK
jgi:hypothetical protein